MDAAGQEQHTMYARQLPAVVAHWHPSTLQWNWVPAKWIPPAVQPVLLELGGAEASRSYLCEVHGPVIQWVGRILHHHQSSRSLGSYLRRLTRRPAATRFLNRLIGWPATLSSLYRPAGWHAPKSSIKGLTTLQRFFGRWRRQLELQNFLGKLNTCLWKLGFGYQTMSQCNLQIIHISYHWDVLSKPLDT